MTVQTFKVNYASVIQRRVNYFPDKISAWVWCYSQPALKVGLLLLATQDSRCNTNHQCCKPLCINCLNNLMVHCTELARLWQSLAHLFTCAGKYTTVSMTTFNNCILIAMYDQLLDEINCKVITSLFCNHLGFHTSRWALFLSSVSAGMNHTTYSNSRATEGGVLHTVTAVVLRHCTHKVSIMPNEAQTLSYSGSDKHKPPYDCLSWIMINVGCLQTAETLCSMCL